MRGGARAHAVVTKATSVPRGHPLLSMPDSLSVTGVKKQNTDPVGRMSVCEVQAAATITPTTLPKSIVSQLQWC